jgi:hypothetical protein
MATFVPIQDILADKKKVMMENPVAPDSNEQLENADIYKIVEKHAKRLGIDPDVAYENAIRFADQVGKFENSGKLEGTNVPQKGKDASTAKGLYQFLDGSVGPAMNRLGRIVDITDMPTDPNEMTWNQQTKLFLADVLDKTAVVNGKEVKGLGDELMKEVLTNGENKKAIRDAYYVLHHTKPDEATKRMTEEKQNEPLY